MQNLYDLLSRIGSHFLRQSMAKKIEVRITSDPQMLSVLRAAITQVCQLAGFTSMETSKIVLAVDEACSNIMRHSYKGKKNQPIIVTCKLKPTKLEIIMHDFGNSVDVKKIRSRKLNDLRPGGLGVHIMKSIMDRVIFKNGTDEGNFLIMQKALPKRQ